MSDFKKQDYYKVLDQVVKTQSQKAYISAANKGLSLNPHLDESSVNSDSDQDMDEDQNMSGVDGGKDVSKKKKRE